jgi:tRNA threonylcarbamoyladenosine biosynthesis protein TsaE
MTASRTILEQFISKSPEETRAWGQRLAERLRAGDCLLLIGALGAGKTTLVQGIALGLGVPLEKVRSPTFVLIHEYAGRIPIYHVDAYRVRSAAELIAVGIEDYFAAGSGIIIIEWGEVVREICPPGSLEIQLEIINEKERRITLTASV